MKLDIKLHKEDLPDEIILGDNIAVDCEFMGLNVDRDPLCLVQISTGKKDAHIIQLNRELYNSPNLKKILIDKKISKIFHYARADLLFIKKYLKINVENVHCTKLMSKLARSYSDKHGLKDLIKEFTGSDISKNLQSSDFGGALTDKQLEYCAKDVIYLHEIYEGLKKILIREKRHGLYNNTIKFIHNRVDLDLASFSFDIWSH
tara:strand:+ start:2045 stop:2656 length:612 start_codon:yes stop_codon:yes gene_type:complete